VAVVFLVRVVVPPLQAQVVVAEQVKQEQTLQVLEMVEEVEQEDLILSLDHL
jgi:hypothetical protein